MPCVRMRGHDPVEVQVVRKTSSVHAKYFRRFAMCLTEQLKIFARKIGNITCASPLPVQARGNPCGPRCPAVVPEPLLQFFENEFRFHGEKDYRLMLPINQQKNSKEISVEKLGRISLKNPMSESKQSELNAKISDRVEALLKSAGLKKQPFAHSVGLNDAHFRHLLAGRARWNSWHLEIVAKGLGISPADLIENRPTQVILKEAPSLSVQTVPRFETFHETFAPNNYIPIRLVEGAASAGPPSDVLESEISSWVLIYASKEWMPNDPENYTCVRVKGESMYPVLSDGDIIAVDHAARDPELLDGKMAVFRVNGGITIKWLKFHRDKGVVVGIPENKDALDHVVMLAGDEINAGIVGKVAWWWAKRS